jgi:mutator protein MutT
VVGVGAVVVRDGRVLLIRRGKEPMKGRWLIPGGTVEYGETLEDALVREVQEETGVTVAPREMVAVIDRIHRDEQDHVVHHFVIVDYLCDWVAGAPEAGSDAEAAAFVGVEDLPRYDLPGPALEVIEDGLRRCGVPLPSAGERSTMSSNTLRLKG